MATGPKSRPQNRKRQHAEAHLEQDPPSRPSKRFKPTKEHRPSSNFPPAFYNSLSKVWLTRRALRELDRRNQPKCSDCAQAPAPKPLRQLKRKDLQRFARHGGPELCDLRGYPESTDVHRAHTMSSNRASRSSQSKQSKSARPSSNSTSQTSNNKTRSSAYDNNFERYIINEKVFPKGYQYPDDRPTPEPDNEDELNESLARSRPSLSPSRFTSEDFRRFARDNDRAYEGSVMSTVFPTIRGQHTDIPHEVDAPFAGLESITKEVITSARPDFYDGANPGNIDKQVQAELGPFIIPTVQVRAPAVPNFFLEAKPPSGNVDVARRQATLNGALGARAMHKLQSYAAGKPVYDGNAYTLTSTYHAGTGTLQMYTTHITPPGGPREPPEYHMNQQCAFALTNSVDTCRQGLTAFRNGRDWSKKKRDQFIVAANDRARSMNAEESTLLSSSNYSRPSCNTYLAEESETSADELATASFLKPRGSVNEPANTSFYSDEEEEEEAETSEDELTTSFYQPVTTSYSHTAKRRGYNSLSNIIEISKDYVDEVITISTSTKKRPRKVSEMTVSKAPRQSTSGRGGRSKK